MSTHTTKSFKNAARDKPKHSDQGFNHAKKGGGGGKGTWGDARDDLKYMDQDGHAMDQNDPNFDPGDQKEAGFILKSVFVPAVEASDKFVNSLKDLSNFKKGVRSAVTEHLISHDVEEFVQAIKELNYELLHQEIPAIAIKAVLDKKDEDRTRVSNLLHELHKRALLTPNQVVQGFTKLFHSLDELTIDFPEARKSLSDFVGHGIATGYLDNAEAAKLEQAANFLKDPTTFSKTKTQIKEMVTEYFTSNELGELETAVATLNTAVHFEVVKQLVSISLDRTSKEREVASVGLAGLTGKVVSADSVSKAFLVMLGRVEDTILDVPNVLTYLSCFLARAVVDEVLPPSFLVRVDLSELDMGFQVIAQAEVLVNTPNAYQTLQTCWTVGEEQKGQ